ncbi:GPI_anchor biosynthesis pro [Enterospora canceri]|uniref:GPI_anchor biosynthesis pro n=1 Tax=Enterospora canceri TaxID=1081671 RepID=A0A1Y1S9R6_9MICR|nr:GPI_anchor biosynthesis pro [Enterospora canceri]
MRIALVSDMFHPEKGGVETHILTMALKYVEMGHQVIVVTHGRGGSRGIVHYRGIRVFYLNIPIMCRNVAWPCLFIGFKLYRQILIDNAIEVVHGHQTHSTMTLEMIYHARKLGIRTFLTEHSLYDMGKLERILADTVIGFVLNGISGVICVSEATKQNIQTRFKCIKSDKLSVIPNGVDTNVFYKNEKYSCKEGERTRVCFMGRLEYRKGVNILIEALPEICKNKNLQVEIVGDGHMRDDLLCAIDQHDLHNQVTMHGCLNQSEMAEMMRNSSILLNTSLTESFCMVVVEALACGMDVVTTNVGGIAEMQWRDRLFFCKPTACDIRIQIENAIKSRKINQNLDEIASEFLWDNIAQTTLELYRNARPIAFSNHLTPLITWQSLIFLIIFLIDHFVCYLF